MSEVGFSVLSSWQCCSLSSPRMLAMLCPILALCWCLELSFMVDEIFDQVDVSTKW